MGRGHAGKVDMAGRGGERRIRSRSRRGSLALLGCELSSMGGVEAIDVAGVAEVGGGEEGRPIGQTKAGVEFDRAQIAGILARIRRQGIRRRVGSPDGVELHVGVEAGRSPVESAVGQGGRRIGRYGV